MDDAASCARTSARVEQGRQWCVEQLWLQPCAVALVVGRGMSDVAVTVGGLVGSHGRAIGIDRSSRLVDRARRRARDVPNVEYRVGDLASLPFDDGTFDAAYADGAFVHLDDPDAAMVELHRVLRPGGRLVIVDLDHARTAIDADDAELAELLTARPDRGTANVRSGRRLRSQAVQAGFVDVGVEVEARIVTNRDEYQAIDPRRMASSLADLVTLGIIDRERADAFLADQAARADEGRFQVTVVKYVVASAKPAGARPVSAPVSHR